MICNTFYSLPKKKNPNHQLANYGWFGFYCSMSWKRSRFLWKLRAVAYHCTRELFSHTSLLVMIYNAPFYLNPGVANPSYTARTALICHVVYSHICESLDHSCSLQDHFSVINRSYSKLFHCISQNLWAAGEIIAREGSTYICALQKVWRISATKCLLYFSILKMNLTPSSVYHVKESYYIKFDK